MSIDTLALKCQINKVKEPVLYGYNRIDHEEDDELHYYEINGLSAKSKCFTWSVRYNTTSTEEEIQGKTAIVLCNEKKWYNESLRIEFDVNAAKIYYTSYKKTSEVFSILKRDLLSSTKYRTYWVSWYKGLVKVGREGDDPFINLVKEIEYKVNWVALYSEPEGGEYIIRLPYCPTVIPEPEDDFVILFLDCY